MVGCETDEASDYFLEKPCLIVVRIYRETRQARKIASVYEYFQPASILLVVQNKPEVEMFYREPEGKWWVQTYTGIEQVFSLTYPPISSSLADIYEAIQFAA